MGTHWLDIQPRTNLGTQKYHLINFEVCYTFINALLFDDIRCNEADVHDVGRNAVAFRRAVFNDTAAIALVLVVDANEVVCFRHLLDALTEIPESLVAILRRIALKISRNDLQFFAKDGLCNPMHVTDTDKKRESTEYTPGSTWLDSCESAEILYKDMIALGMRPEQARCVLPLCLKTEIVVTANYREWRNIFKLRTPVAAHPQMRELMCPLLKELQSKIPVVFDDIYTYWPEDDQTGKGSMVK